ncbi:hypothetical protein M436DRAFT_65706 [Aureobasidium namibiae CBS 147.97]|uniref:Uncharacterized protein n=1 Tax=Aureobasidium namibiae CBS 147.97 TaxID=1043004 RepID=A0A074WGY2_9PEZI
MVYRIPSLRGTSNNLIFPGDFEGMQKSAVGFARHDSYAYQTTGEAVVSGAATLCSSPGWLQTRNDMRSWRTRLAGTLVNVPWTDFQSQEAFADRRKVEYGRALCIQSNLVNYPDVNANAGNNDKDSRQLSSTSLFFLSAGIITWEKSQPQLGRLGYTHARPVDAQQHAPVMICWHRADSSRSRSPAPARLVQSPTTHLF